MDICRICLALDTKVFKLGNNEAKCFIENIFMQNGFKQDLQETHSICFECKALLDKSYKFFKRVLKAQDILYNMLKKNQPITPIIIKQIDRKITGFNLVKDFKYIDLYICDDDTDIKNVNILQNFQCKVEIDDLHNEDPLEDQECDYTKHSLTFENYSLKTDDSTIDVKDFHTHEAKEEQFDDNCETAMHYQFDESVSNEDVKDEILDESDNKTLYTKKKRHRNKTLKNSEKVPSKKNKAMGRKQKYASEIFKGNYAELFDYDGGDDLGSVQQCNHPKYPVKCHHCSYDVPNKMAHFHHYQLEHKDKKYPYGKRTGKQFVCQFCGLINSLKSRHIDHELTHGNVKNFTCPQCCKSFMNRHRLRKHIYRAHPAQMFQCDYCGKQVKSRESLMIHIRIHTGERPFKCPICGAGFAHRGNIRPHIRANHDHCDVSTVELANKKKTLSVVNPKQILELDNARLSSEMFINPNAVMNNNNLR